MGAYRGTEGERFKRRTAAPEDGGRAEGTGMATGKDAGTEGMNGNGGVALLPGTAEPAPALLLEALIRPWFGFGRVGVILRGSRLEVVLWICLGAPGPGAETPAHP